MHDEATARRWSDIAGARVLLVGAGRHRPGSTLPDVDSVRTTVLDLGRALAEHCGLSPDAIRTLLDPASPIELGDAIGASVEEAEGLLVVYFVGHGLVDQNSVLHLSTASTDTRPTRLSHTALAYPVLRQYALEFLNSGFDRSLVVVLDCCFSGRAIRSLSPAGIEDAVAQIAGVTGGYVLTSAGRDQLALAPEGQRHTLFSGALLRLLKDGDSGGPAELTLDDVTCDAPGPDTLRSLYAWVRWRPRQASPRWSCPSWPGGTPAARRPRPDACRLTRFRPCAVPPLPEGRLPS